MEATLVGGGAVEFYDPGAHTTSDIDLVVERRLEIPDLEPELTDVFTGLVPLSSEEDVQISLAAARAIAVAKFDPGQFADLMVLKRVQEIKSGVRP